MTIENNAEGPDLGMFDSFFSVAVEEIEVILHGHDPLPWADFFLNPRRLRGSDFLMRWSQGQWSEERLIQAVNDSSDYYAIPYGPSGVAPDEPREFESYFERLEKAGLGGQKRPDILMFRKSEARTVDSLVKEAGGHRELPFTPESELSEILKSAIVAVESENSLWKAELMPYYGKPMTEQKRLKGKLGFPKTAVLPTMIIKDEDIKPLKKWQETQRIPIHIWHVFFDLAYGISLNDALKLVNQGFIEPTEQIFQAPGGPTTKKTIFKIYYSLVTKSEILSKNQS